MDAEREDDDHRPAMVPREILDGLEAVRRSGLVNMLDRNGVAEVAMALGLPAGAEWVAAEPDQYARGISRGFEAEE